MTAALMLCMMVKNMPWCRTSMAAEMIDKITYNIQSGTATFLEWTAGAGAGAAFVAEVGR
jgi:hypothetical protein